jgi:LysR family hydrogen peroxide-inducible transcriptional activator
LSAQLAQLEDALGVKLFERSRRGVLITGPGEVLVERARRMLLDADDLVQLSRRVSDPLSGTLRLGVIPTLSPYLLPAFTPALRKAYPKLTVRWVEEKTEVLVQRVEAGALDAALLALEADLGPLETERIAEDPFVLATPPGHELGARKQPATMDELRGADVLLLDEGHCFRAQALAVCSRAKAHELEFRATSLPTLVQMVAGGSGVTLLPKLAVKTETQRSDLRIRPMAAPVPHRTIALAWRPRSPLAESLKKLSATMRKAWP